MPSGPRAIHAVGGERTPPPPLGHSNTAARRASPSQLHCSSPISTTAARPLMGHGDLPPAAVRFCLQGVALRPIKTAAPVWPQFCGGAGRTRSPPHHGGGGGERLLTWPCGHRGGAALPRDIATLTLARAASSPRSDLTGSRIFKSSTSSDQMMYNTCNSITDD